MRSHDTDNITVRSYDTDNITVRSHDTDNITQWDRMILIISHSEIAWKMSKLPINSNYNIICNIPWINFSSWCYVSVWDCDWVIRCIWSSDIYSNSFWYRYSCSVCKINGWNKIKNWILNNIVKDIYLLQKENLFMLWKKFRNINFYMKTNIFLSCYAMSVIIIVSVVVVISL